VLFGFFTAFVLTGCSSAPEEEERARTKSKYMLDFCERFGACDKGGPAGPGPQSPCTGTGESCFPHANEGQDDGFVLSGANDQDNSAGDDGAGNGNSNAGDGAWDDGWGNGGDDWGNGGWGDDGWGDQGGWGDDDWW